MTIGVFCVKPSCRTRTVAAPAAIRGGWRGPMPPPARGSLSTTWTSGIWRDDSVSGSKVIHRGRRSRVKGREEASSASVNYLNASSRGKLCSSVTRKSRIKVVTPGVPVLQGRDPGRSVSASDAESCADRLSDSGGCDDDPSHDSTNFKLYRGQAGQLLPNQRPGKPAARRAGPPRCWPSR
jgi:hypothetical protein